MRLRSSLLLLLGLTPLLGLAADGDDQPISPDSPPDFVPPPPPTEKPPAFSVIPADSEAGLDTNPLEVAFATDGQSIVLRFATDDLSGPPFLRYSSDFVNWHNVALPTAVTTRFDGETASAKEVSLPVSELESLGARFFRVRLITRL
jgi:hypothetical protein